MMAPNDKAEQVGVLGSPVAENPRGLMQEAAFAALNGCQGAIDFKMWTGCDAPVDLMRAALAKEFGLD